MTPGPLRGWARGIHHTWDQGQNGVLGVKFTFDRRREGPPKKLYTPNEIPLSGSFQTISTRSLNGYRGQQLHHSSRLCPHPWFGLPIHVQRALLASSGFRWGRVSSPCSQVYKRVPFQTFCGSCVGWTWILPPECQTPPTHIHRLGQCFQPGGCEKWGCGCCGRWCTQQ